MLLAEMAVLQAETLVRCFLLHLCVWLLASRKTAELGNRFFWTMAAVPEVRRDAVSYSCTLCACTSNAPGEQGSKSGATDIPQFCSGRLSDRQTNNIMFECLCVCVACTPGTALDISLSLSQKIYICLTYVDSPSYSWISNSQ